MDFQPHKSVHWVAQAAPAGKEVMTIERCEIRRCRTEADLTYLEHGVCNRHWNQLTAEDAPSGALRIALGIEGEAPTATEDSTMATTTDKTSKKSKKSTPKAKAAKESKPMREKAPREPQVVFAFRLSEADRALIHKAAGPAQATRFVRTAALAAAGADRKAFDTLVEQAKTNLK